MAWKIDGTEVQAPDIKSPVSFNDISRSWEDIDGIFRDRLIRRKRTSDWIYSCLPDDKYQIIHNLIQAKLDVGSRYFMITRYSPGEGELTSLMYLGTPTKFIPQSYNKDGTPAFWEVTLAWIEVQGTKLNSTTGEIPS